jgi:hypothetical protein
MERGVSSSTLPLDKRLTGVERACHGANAEQENKSTQHDNTTFMSYLCACSAEELN